MGKYYTGMGETHASQCFAQMNEHYCAVSIQRNVFGWLVLLGNCYFIVEVLRGSSGGK